jgi:Ribbon-helix-helix protein, copG family
MVYEWCMKRTNIYLGEAQSAALDQVAHAQGISRAELIRQLIDTGIGTAGGTDLDSDLAAIRESFGVLTGEDVAPVRGADERARHLDRVRSR